mmetsp:Transcript_20736/g.41881  ORF Transcript_20736/g.41881 Transcript_20736/m.41881 type:complete len:213 (-) Transcript_20736:5573-6211(-)
MRSRSEGRERDVMELGRGGRLGRLVFTLLSLLFVRVLFFKPSFEFEGCRPEFGTTCAVFLGWSPILPAAPLPVPIFVVSEGSRNDLVERSPDDEVLLPSVLPALTVVVGSAGDCTETEAAYRGSRGSPTPPLSRNRGDFSSARTAVDGCFFLSRLPPGPPLPAATTCPAGASSCSASVSRPPPLAPTWLWLPLPVASRCPIDDGEAKALVLL